MRILFMGTLTLPPKVWPPCWGRARGLCRLYPARQAGGPQADFNGPADQTAGDGARHSGVSAPHSADGSSDDVIKELAPDIIVVVAYGCIIPPQLLHAEYGCINLHVLLLPKYRGSAPIQWSVLNGNAGTGVTIMQLDEGLDTGDILMVGTGRH